MPRHLGGHDLDIHQFHEIVGILAAADASVGWCINQNNVFSTHCTRHTEQTQAQIWGDPRTVVATGTPIPGAKSNVVEGGYVVNGTWRFASGIGHCNWVSAQCPAFRPGETEPFAAISCFIPISQVVLGDAWDVGGLKGTGSYSYTVDDVFVPSTRAINTSAHPDSPDRYTTITTTPLFASGFATVALAVARSALAAAIDTAKVKARQGRDSELRQESTTQRSIAHAHAILNAAGTYLTEAVSEMWEASASLEPLPLPIRMETRLASTHAINEAARATDIAYEVCGSNSIFDTHPIQRKFQDIHAVTQQIQGRLTHYDTVGQHLLGLEPKGIF